MTSRKEYPVRFIPRGLVDAYDASLLFPGACVSLKNLIFDQKNPAIVVARPGVGSPIFSFATGNNATFTNPSFISVHITVGQYVFGMITTTDYAGKDIPFCYDTIQGKSLAISGLAIGNLPSSAQTSGEWVPPAMAVVGIKILVTHSGFTGGNCGTIDITSITTPSWSSGTTATNALPSVPTNVTNFNNRAYFSCGNKLFYSDVLVPNTITNAGQSLTISDTAPITALSGLPVQTSSTGIISALIVFKAFQIWQISGDGVTLSVDFLSLTIGTIAPRSVVQTPIGVIFIATDGPYFISSATLVFPLTKDLGKATQDIQIPFQNAVYPSRMAASFSGSIYRVCVDTILDGINSTNDYWFDIIVKRWTGPHTFQTDCVSQIANAWVVSGRGIGAKLFLSGYITSVSTVYVDNGVQYPCSMVSSFLPNTENINVKSIVESTIELSNVSQTVPYSITALDEKFTNIGQVSIGMVQTSLPKWGTPGLFWGSSGLIWSSIINRMLTFSVNWPSLIVFKKIAIQISCVPSSALAIGMICFKYKDTGYTNI